MRIGIDIRSTLKKKTGIGYYTLNLIKNLSEIDTVNQYSLYSKIGLFNRDKKLPQINGGNFGHCVNRLGINPLFLLKNLDIFHTSSYDLPKPKKTKLVVVVHDVIHKAYPLGHSKKTIEDVDKKLINILPQADRIIAVSENTKNDILRFYKINSDKIDVIYSGIDDNIYKLPKKDSSLGKYLLFVGTIEPRKNVSGLINAYHILKTKYKIPHKLIIAGMLGWSYNDVPLLVEKLKLQNDVEFTGYITRERTNILYNNADVFIYPSFYEGFGFPILEAFKCGAAVVTSNTSSCAELAKDAALLVNPSDTEEIAESIFKIISDENLKQTLQLKGLNRAKEFSWKNTANNTLKLFERVVEC